MTMQDSQTDHATAIAGGVESIEPAFIMPVGEGSNLRGAVVSPDGSVVWVLSQARVVDVGWTIDKHLPKVVTASVILATVVLLIWLRRALLRRAVPGVMHCRRCDYNVTETGAAGKCPECGVDLAKRKPVVGRRPLRRLWLPVTLTVVVAGGAGWYFIDGKSRFRYPFPPGRWGSLTLTNWSAKPWLSWLESTSAFGQLVVEVDVATGETRRKVAALPYSSYTDMQYNPFARALYINDGAGRVDLVSVDSGSTIASITGWLRMNRGTPGPLMIGHDRSGEIAYLDAENLSNGQAAVVEWSWKTGVSRVLFTAEPGEGGTEPVARRHLVVPGEQLRFVRYTDFMENMHDKYRLWLLDESGAVLSEQALEDISPLTYPAFSVDGASMFIETKAERTIMRLNTATLAREAEFETDLTAWLCGTPLSHDGRLIAVAGPRSIQVHDTSNHELKARLLVPDTEYGPSSLTFSTDGRVFGGIFASNRFTGTGKILGVWRLPDLLSDKPKNTP